MSEKAPILSSGEALAQHLENILRDANKCGLTKPPFYITLVDDSTKSKWQLCTENGAPPLTMLNTPARRPLDYPLAVFVSQHLYPNELTTGDVVLSVAISQEPMMGDITALHTEVYPFRIPSDAALKAEIVANWAVLGWIAGNRHTDGKGTVAGKMTTWRQQLRALIPRINEQVSYVRQRLKEGNTLGWYLCGVIDQQHEPVKRGRVAGFTACPVRRDFEKQDTWKLMLAESPALGFIHSVTTRVAGTEHTRTDYVCETWELAAQFNVAEQVRAYGKEFMEDLKNGNLTFGFRPLGMTRDSQERKMGRNDPCPCASGKKYKRCCGK